MKTELSHRSLSAYCQFMANQAFLNRNDPHRPMPSADLGRMEELLISLSRARAAYPPTTVKGLLR